MAELDGEELLVLARLDIEKGAFEGALSKLKAAASLSGAPPEAALELARLYAQLRLFSKAEAQFVKVLDSSGRDYPDVRFQLGMVRFEKGDIAGAIACWDKVLEADAGYPPALYYYSVALGRIGRREEARTRLATLVRLVPSDNLYHGKAKELLGTLASLSSGDTDADTVMKPEASSATQH